MLAEDFKKFFRGEVYFDGATLEKYSEDASIFKVKPEVVVAPRDVEDLKNLVKFVAAEKKKGKNISLTARSGGTDMSGGPLNESIIIDFTKYFNRIKEVGDGYARVEPGVFYRDFEKQTLAKGGQIIPSYPASREICTVGGMVANNSAGEKTLAYGKTEDYILELKAVLADGEEYIIKPLTKAELNKKLKQKNFEGKMYRKLYKLIEDNYDLIKKAKPNVSKNSAGYYLWNVWDRKKFDLTKLIVGSQGTLAFLTEIKFRLIKKKLHSRLVVAFLKDLAPLVEIIHTALAFKPESFESYDDKTLKLAIRFFPDILKIMKGNVFSFALQFVPELFIILRHGMPKLVLLVQLTGDDELELTRRERELTRALEKFHVPLRTTKTEDEEKKYWTIRRESFNLLRNRVEDKHTAPFVDDVIVRPEKLTEFLPRLAAIIEKHKDKMISTIAGHAGDGNFHIIPLMNLADPEARALIPKVALEVYDLVKEFGGSFTAEHNDGLIRTPYLKKMFGSKIVKLFAETKKIFDPDNIFNPKKKVGGDLRYALGHVKHE
ncbi:MAG: FAD-binding oxidoreductase [Candidatus Liptonbacteria bacterium]|nr:FAD-binding oxidoreductase [Candidatus Liptonbacteria bacterium]